MNMSIAWQRRCLGIYGELRDFCPQRQGYMYKPIGVRFDSSPPAPTYETILI